MNNVYDPSRLRNHSLKLAKKKLPHAVFKRHYVKPQVEEPIKYKNLIEMIDMLPTDVEESTPPHKEETPKPKVDNSAYTQFEQEFEAFARAFRIDES